MKKLNFALTMLDRWRVSAVTASSGAANAVTLYGTCFRRR